jgi:DNA-directed RNA polymerase subunit E'/Rpb7
MSILEGGAITTSRKGRSGDSGLIDEERLFVQSILTHRIILKPAELASNIKDILTNAIKRDVERKCIKEGYILPDSVELEQYSCPKLDRGNIIYHASYKCQICYPCEGMIIEAICDVKSRAGIHALYQYVGEINNEIITPIEVFIYRDHNLDDMAAFNRIKEKDKFRVCIIGTRIELGSSSISVIGKIV